MYGYHRGCSKSDGRRILADTIAHKLVAAAGPGILRRESKAIIGDIREESTGIISTARGLPNGLESPATKSGLFCHELGVSYGPYPKNIGLDLQLLNYKNWGLQTGASYFQEERKLGETLTVGYNIHRLTHDFTKNTWIVFGGSYSRRTGIINLRIGL